MSEGGLAADFAEMDPPDSDGAIDRRCAIKRR